MKLSLRRSVPILAGIAGLITLSSCTDGHLVDPDDPATSARAGSPGRTVPSTTQAVHVRVQVPYAISILARIVDPAADLSDPRNFDVKRCVRTNLGYCEAIFDLSVGSRYVFSAEPLRIDDPQDHLVWANHRPVPTFEGFLAEFHGTVFVQSDDALAGYSDGESRRKTDENLDLAYARAKPLPGNGTPTLSIELQSAQVRVNSCLGVPNATYVFGGVLFDPVQWSNIPVSPTPNSPAIAQYVTRVEAAEPCEVATDEDRIIIFKGYNYVTDQSFSGSLDAFSTDPVNMTPDQSYVVQHYIPDPRGDGNPDGDYMTFGLLTEETDHLHWKVNSIGLVGAQQQTSTWEFDFRFRASAGDPETLLAVTLSCNENGDGDCELVQVQPADLTWMVIRNPADPDEFGRVDSTTGMGYLQLRLDVAAVHSARLRARTVDTRSLHERPGDFIPDQGLTAEYLNIFDGRVHWVRGADLTRGRSRSLHIPF